MIKSKKKRFTDVVTDNYLELLKYKYLSSKPDILETDKKILLAVKLNTFRKNITAVNLVSATEDICRYLNGLQQNIIPVLDLESINIKSDDLLWNFLKTLQFNCNCKTLIVLNIANYIVENAINNLISDKDIFWDKDKFLILYHFEKDELKNFIYYTEVLGGASLAEYRILRNKLDSTHFTCKPQVSDIKYNSLSNSTLKNIESSGIYVKNTTILQNFELIITHDKKTLFEISMGYILNTDVDIKHNDFSGYKILNSHFRLGSKVHIRDFVYAKRIFQNSFFTNRFAFLTAKYFLETYPNVKSLTIVSYGFYSQLLINRIERIIQAYTKGNVNHNVVSDAEDPYFIDNIKWNNHVLIVVPINTTFSTTIKIENLVKEELKGRDVEIITPSFNLILVTHGNFENESYVSKLNTFFKKGEPFYYEGKLNNPPYKILNWKRIDIQSRTVSVQTNPPDPIETKQLYLLSVESELYLPDECHLCYPGYRNSDLSNEILYEELLLETDKVSVTPEMILDLPRNYTRKIKSFDQTVYINQEAHYFGHFEYEGKHYTHFINPVPFFLKYHEKIRKWASWCREELFDKTPDILNSGVLLLSVGNRNNTYFTDFINRHIFDDAAVIIHYDISGNYIDNFVKFFNPHVNNSKYIFIVDDLIKSSEAINKLNDIVLVCNNRKKAIDGIFTLISSVNDYNLTNIKSRLSYRFSDKLKYNSFFFLNLELDSSIDCPVCAKRDHYLKMAQNSIHDSVKHYFLNKALRLKVENISDILENKFTGKMSAASNMKHSSERDGWIRYNPLIGIEGEAPWGKEKKLLAKQLFKSFQQKLIPDKYYMRLLVSHELNRLLSLDDVIRAEIVRPYFKRRNFNGEKVRTINLFSLILKKIKSSEAFKNLYQKYNELTKKVTDDIISDLVLEILTEAPFLTIKPLKEKVFFWTILQLDPLISNHQTNEKSFPEFRKIKFLLKKTAILGSNYSIHPLTMERVKNIYKGYDLRTDNFKQRWHEKLEQVSRLHGLLENNQIMDAHDRKQYIAQIERNIEYIEASLREFSYFFLAVIKEATIGSDASIVKLEKTINSSLQMTNAEVEVDFYYFLRLIKFENAFILRKGIHTIYESFSQVLQKKLTFNYQQKALDTIKGGVAIEPTTQSDIDVEISKMLGNYRLLGLKSYLNIHLPFLIWKKQHFYEYAQFMQMVYLYSLLKNDEEKFTEKVLLEERTKFILQQCFYIAGYSKLIQNKQYQIVYKETMDAGAFMVLKLHEGKNKVIGHDKLIVAAITRPYKPTQIYEIFNAPIDEESLTYIMFNGVSNKRYTVFSTKDEVKKPWILWEITKNPGDEKIWQSQRGSIYPIEPAINNDFDKIANEKNGIQTFTKFTESVFLRSNINSLMFMRFTDVFDDSDAIVNNVNAVIGFFSEKTPLEFNQLNEIRKVCLTYAVLPLINNFIHTHYDSAFLNSSRNTWHKLIERDKFKHGHTGFLDNYRRVLNLQSKSDNDEQLDTLSKILYNILRYSNNISELLENYSEIDAEHFIGYEKMKNLKLKKMNSNQVVHLICAYYQIILQHEFGITEGYNTEPIISVSNNISEDLTIFISQTLFDILISELLINAKKNSSGKVFCLNIKLDLVQSKLFMLSIGNNCKPPERKLINKLNKPIANSTHGLGLVDHITVSLFKTLSLKELTHNTLFDNYGGAEFTISFPIAKFHE